jgi:hypothetical protein
MNPNNAGIKRAATGILSGRANPGDVPEGAIFDVGEVDEAQ